MIRETAAERVVFTKTTKKVKGCRGCYSERGIATTTTASQSLDCLCCRGCYGERGIATLFSVEGVGAVCCRGCYGERGIATATTLKFLQNASTPVAEGVTVNVVLQQKYNMGGKGCRGCYSG